MFWWFKFERKELKTQIRFDKPRICPMPGAYRSGGIYRALQYLERPPGFHAPEKTPCGGIVEKWLYKSPPRSNGSASFWYFCGLELGVIKNLRHRNERCREIGRFGNIARRHQTPQ
jgi:hypothetical protein